MIKMNRTTEYGLIALRHMSRKTGTVTSAREIADCYGFPFEITAKTLQRLRDTGLIQSAQGSRGGYRILKDLGQVSLAEFMSLMEGVQGVVPCSGHDVGETYAVSGPCACEYHGRCEIRGVMGDLNRRVQQFLAGIRLEDLTSDSGRTRERTLALAAGNEP